METDDSKMHPRLQAVAPLNLARVIGGFDSIRLSPPSGPAPIPLNQQQLIGGADSAKASHPRLQAVAPMNLAKVIGDF
ncbi:hypothetical protein [Biostraticola tofi]|uniref:Uncharacterized protein n=1 Tax=Biostraticola tofi TaxID=466109 RepID=A0A4R3Z411_9GAMM|nr:hypothetical protein [Biostraticola tofi]TCV99788.1 hypothetical protein EDC52_101125 [Biostraticola tofi]